MVLMSILSSNENYICAKNDLHRLDELFSISNAHIYSNNTSFKKYNCDNAISRHFTALELSILIKPSNAFALTS